MIYTSGVVTFLSNSIEPTQNFNLKKDKVSLEVIRKLDTDSVDRADSTVKITCKFSAILPESFECRSLEDYTGKVKPFLQQFINDVILSVEVHHLNYVSKHRKGL